jgi:hypothetical protein
MSQTLLSLAGFQVIISGRFWVIAEASRTASTPSEASPTICNAGLLPSVEHTNRRNGP